MQGYSILFFVIFVCAMPIVCNGQMDSSPITIENTTQYEAEVFTQQQTISIPAHTPATLYISSASKYDPLVKVVLKEPTGNRIQAFLTDSAYYPYKKQKGELL